METVWTFSTKRFTVELAIDREDASPSDHFDDPRDIAYAQEDDIWHWFYARVRVVFRDVGNPQNWAVTPKVKLGRAYLNGCSYENLEQFRRDGLADLVYEAIRETRGTIERMSL